VKYLSWLKNLKSKKNLFYNLSANQIQFEEKSINRLFHPIICKYNLEKQSSVINSGINYPTKNYPAEFDVNFNFGQEHFLAWKKFTFKIKNKFTRGNKIELKNLNEFDTYLKTFSIFNDFTDILNYTIEKKYFIELNLSFYTKLLKKINPQNLFILAYYESSHNFLITAAANDLNIRTIEMQHGPHPEFHLGYCIWTKIPKFGFNTIPYYYWCWDNISTLVFNSWIPNIYNFKAFVGGNPWVEYWKHKLPYTNLPKFILYTLQPAPLTLELLFPPEIIKIIKSKKITWYLRLHPLQQENLNEIVAFLKEKEIYDLVNIKDANNNHLPLLLYSCQFHVSNYSGSIIEASLFYKFSIILHTIGENGFKELIQEKRAIYLPPNSPNFESTFNEIIDSFELTDNKNIFQNKLVESEIEESEIEIEESEVLKLFN